MTPTLQMAPTPVRSADRLTSSAHSSIVCIVLIVALTIVYATLAAAMTPSSHFKADWELYGRVPIPHPILDGTACHGKEYTVGRALVLEGQCD